MTSPDCALDIKRTLARTLRRKLAAEGMSISQFAQQIGTGRTAVRRILDEKNTAITLNTMNRAARVLGFRLVLTAHPMTPKELGSAARAMANAASDSDARHFRDRIMRGFYGDASSPAHKRSKAPARTSAR